MENPSGLLIAAILLPLCGAVLVSALSLLDPKEVRWGALAVTVLTFIVAIMLVANFPVPSPGEPTYASTHAVWLPPESGVEVSFSLGLDGIALALVALTALLMVTAVLVSWEAITDRPALFYGMLLCLESGCIGVFAARDILLFYIFFEFTLIPLFFLIGIWGSEERRYAAVKFFLFTLAGSLLTFLGLLALVLWVYQHDAAPQPVFSFSLAHIAEQVAAQPLPLALQITIFIALFAGFAIKVPLFPLHTWLPLAHVQAPTAGSVILAGVLLKIGTYGFLRFSIPLLPDATVACTPYLLGLSVAGIIYGALVALVQADVKRLIAYSSVSHMGFCMIGLFAMNRLGLQGGTLQMVNHGISTGGLFAIVGMLYERYHTRQVADYGGLARRLPVLSFFMLVFTFSSIGLPGTNGFAGEFPILAGLFQRAWLEPNAADRGPLLVMAVLSVSGVVLGAWYMLWLVQRVFFGPLKEPAAGEGHEHAAVHDLSVREICALAPLVVVVFWIGLAPNYIFERLAPSLDRVLATAPAAKVEAPVAATAQVDESSVPQTVSN